MGRSGSLSPILRASDTLWLGNCYVVCCSSTYLSYGLRGLSLLRTVIGSEFLSQHKDKTAKDKCSFKVSRLSLKVVNFLGFEVGNGHSVENNCLSEISRGLNDGKCLSIFQVGDAERQENQSCIAELEVLLILFQPYTYLDVLK